MNKKILITASILGLLSIVLGAFASHGLKEVLTTEHMHTFEIGVRYQMYHALLLLFVGSTIILQQKTKRIIYYLVLIGVLFFSGSLYGLATISLTGINFKVIGFITPIGGLLLIMAWLAMLVDFIKNKVN